MAFAELSNLGATERRPASRSAQLQLRIASEPPRVGDESIRDQSRAPHRSPGGAPPPAGSRGLVAAPPWRQPHIESAGRWWTRGRRGQPEHFRLVSSLAEN